MDAIGLLVTVENELGVAVAPTDLFANPTLGEFVAYVEGLLPGARERPFPAEEPA